MPDVVQAEQVMVNDALDPLSLIISVNLGGRLAALGRYDEAIRQMRSTLELHPNSAQGHRGLCYVYVLAHLPREAIPASERATALSSPREALMGLLAYGYAASGNRAKAAAIVRELEARSRREYVSPLGIAIGYLGLGDTATMFAWLDSAYAARDPHPREQYLPIPLLRPRALRPALRPAASADGAAAVTTRDASRSGDRYVLEYGLGQSGRGRAQEAVEYLPARRSLRPVTDALPARPVVN